MKKIIINIDKQLDGRKIKYILHNHLNMSATLVKKLKQTPDGILLNGERVYVIKNVSQGDVLELNMRDEASPNIEPVRMSLDILYEDDDIIAVNKPRAMPTHPSQNHHTDTLANGIMYYFANEKFTFRVITRLDRDTSGVVLIAKNALSAQKLGDSIKNRSVKKKYVAVVNGTPVPLSGRICAKISRADNSTILRQISSDGKEAITDYEVIKSLHGLSLVSLLPHTGRTHQLRVHMSHIGTPIYGDDMYGAPQVGERTRLHCESLCFEHPVTGELITVKAPVPADITELLENI